MGNERGVLEGNMGRGYGGIKDEGGRGERGGEEGRGYDVIRCVWVVVVVCLFVDLLGMGGGEGSFFGVGLKVGLLLLLLAFTLEILYDLGF